MTIESESSVKCLKNFESFVASGLGVAGRPKLMYNGIGGENIVSAVSSRILPEFQSSDAVVKFVQAALIRHIKLYKDGGWSTAFLACRLILDSLKTGIPRCLASEIFDMMISHCVGYLKSNNCKSKVKMDVSTLNHIIGLVNSIVDPKSNNLAMDKSGMESLKIKIIEYFLKYAPGQNNRGDRHILRLHHIINVGLLPPRVDILGGVLIELSGNPLKDCKKLQHLIAAMYECSLTNHDYNELDVSVEVTDIDIIEKASLEVILGHVESLVSQIKVDVLLCQKVIHPRIKCFLLEKGITAMERIGLEKMKAIHLEIGGTVASSFSQPLTLSDMGCLESICTEELDGISHVRIVGLGNVGCLLIDTISREDASEILHLFDASLLALRKAVETGLLLRGGGQWQKELAEMLGNQAPSLNKRWSEMLECSPRQVGLVTETCQRAFWKLHQTINPSDDCDHSTGIENIQETPVLDLYDQVTSCLQTSFFLASAILRTVDFF